MYCNSRKMASHFIIMTTTATTTSTKLLCFPGRNPAVMALFLNICTLGLLSGLSPSLGSGIQKEPHAYSGLQSLPLRLSCSASECRGFCVVLSRKPLPVYCRHRSVAGDGLSGACMSRSARGPSPGATTPGARLGCGQNGKQVEPTGEPGPGFAA